MTIHAINSFLKTSSRSCNEIDISLSVIVVLITAVSMAALQSGLAISFAALSPIIGAAFLAGSVTYLLCGAIRSGRIHQCFNRIFNKPVGPAQQAATSVAQAEHVPPEVVTLEPAGYVPPEVVTLEPAGYVPPEVVTLEPAGYVSTEACSLASDDDEADVLTPTPEETALTTQINQEIDNAVAGDNVFRNVGSGVQITDEIKRDLDDLLRHRYYSEPKSSVEVETFASNGRAWIFRLKQHPTIVFKYPIEDPLFLVSRFKNMLQAQQICKDNKLNLLVVPNATMLALEHLSFSNKPEKLYIIAEEYQDVCQDMNWQKQFYAELSGLEKTLEQLAIFIAKSGFHDVAPRNVLILDDKTDFNGDRRVALVDLEHMHRERVFSGFFGSDCGLIGLISYGASRETFDRLLKMAKRAVDKKDHKYIKERLQERDKEIAEYRAIKALHKRKKIDQDHRAQPIVVPDLSRLGLNLNEILGLRDGETTMKAAIEQVIAIINEEIGKKSSKTTNTIGARNILLDLNHSNFINECLYHGNDENGHVKYYNDDNLYKGWLYRILQALKGHDYITEFHEWQGRGVRVQA